MTPGDDASVEGARLVSAQLVCPCGAAFDAIGTYEAVGSALCPFCGGFLAEIVDGDGVETEDGTDEPQLRVRARPFSAWPLR